MTKLSIHAVKMNDEIFDMLQKVKVKNKLKNREAAIRFLLVETGYIKEE